MNSERPNRSDSPHICIIQANNVFEDKESAPHGQFQEKNTGTTELNYFLRKQFPTEKLKNIFSCEILVFLYVL